MSNNYILNHASISCHFNKEIFDKPVIVKIGKGGSVSTIRNVVLSGNNAVCNPLGGMISGVIRSYPNPSHNGTYSIVCINIETPSLIDGDVKITPEDKLVTEIVPIIYDYPSWIYDQAVINEPFLITKDGDDGWDTPKKFLYAGVESNNNLLFVAAKPMYPFYDLLTIHPKDLPLYCIKHIDYDDTRENDK